uniref:Uncharacterized protein n=1 Tax=Ciona intestinalis TaxID=7719 RepID=H2XQZ7_CIOIN
RRLVRKQRHHLGILSSTCESPFLALAPLAVQKLRAHCIIQTAVPEIDTARGKVLRTQLSPWRSDRALPANNHIPSPVC